MMGVGGVTLSCRGGGGGGGGGMPYRNQDCNKLVQTNLHFQLKL